MENIKRCQTKSIFGLLWTAEHLKQNNINIRTLWNKIYGQPNFRATMGIKRFKQILRFIRFDDKTTCTFRREKDKLDPIHDIFEECNKICGNFTFLEKI